MSGIRKLRLKIYNKLYTCFAKRLLNKHLLCKEDVFKDMLKILGYEYIYNVMIDEIKNNTSLLSIEKQYKHFYKLLPNYSDIFASQEGEDILMKRILKNFYFDKGFFIDVGAHHPVRFSNTFHYYLKGWRGINIDPVPGMKNLFDEYRPDDINIENAISRTEEELDYYQFKESAFNTFSSDNAKHAKSKTELISVDKIKTRRLDEILDRHLPENTIIGFMNIDVEGFEMEVMKSSDWTKYRPYLICIEALEGNYSNIINDFLEDKNYKRIASTKNSIIYIENQFQKKVR